jgi:hydroxyethylthiazole kinase-like sugar kinase family protein
MRKRAVDLSLEELAAMGANAALSAAKKAQDAGLVVTGTVDFIEDGQAVSSLAQRHPSSGAVTQLAAGAGNRGGSKTTKTTKAAIRQSSTD